MPPAGPRSIEQLRELFGDGPLYPSAPGDHFTVDGVEFVCDYRPGSTAERFYIVKDPRYVEGFLQLCDGFQGATIVELGIAEGGSTALLALVARPERLVAIDLEAERVTALDDLLAQRGMDEVVTAHYGVDQSDRERLAELVDAEVGGRPLDLVIDDASHMVDPTRTSFEVLFPRVRPGGLYVVEDWNADHSFRDAVAEQLRQAGPEERAEFQAAARQALQEPQPEPPRPLTDLAIELVLARASEAGEAIAEVTLGQFSLSVRRGPAELDPATFRMADISRDHFGYLGESSRAGGRGDLSG